MTELSDITIYSDRGIFKGNVKSNIINLENKTDPSSILITHEYESIQYNYVNKTKYVVVVDKFNNTHNGVLIHLTDDIVKLKVNTKIVIIRDYFTIEYSSNDSIRINIEPSKIPKFSYTSTSIYWIPEYKLFLDDINKSGKLLQFAIIYSSMELYNNSPRKIKLIYDHINNKQYDRSVQMLQMSESKELGSQSKISDEDYISYDINTPISLEGDIISINLNTLLLKFNKIYVHNVDDNITRFGYEFSSDVFLPGGNISIYKNDVIHGVASIDNVYPGTDETQFVLGNTSKVKVITDLSVQSMKSINSDVDEIKMYDVNFEPEMNDENKIELESENKIKTRKDMISVTTKIINNTKSEIYLIIKYYKGNKTVLSELDTGMEIKNKYIEYNLYVTEQTSYFDFTLELSA